MKSGSLNLLEPSRSHRACYGTTCPSVAHNKQLFSIHEFRENPLTVSDISVSQIRLMRSPRIVVQNL